MNRQQENTNNRDTTAAIYPRLSRFVGGDGDSDSIETQRKLLTKAAKDKGYTKILEFVDDGVSGVTMNRPGFNDMMIEVEKGNVGAVIVKDFSRLGRNHLETGRLTEEYFPEKNVRLVSVSDGYDSAEGYDRLTPIRHLFNEWYSEDISIKQRIRYSVKGNSGEPLSIPPYGYMKNPDNPKFWKIDLEAAAIVRRIYDLFLSGYGTEQIAKTLTDERTLTPIYYWKSRGVKRPHRPHNREPHHWHAATITEILSKQEYVGDVINFKTYSNSFKDKKMRRNKPENIVIFKDVHDPIIDRATFEQIQEKRGKTRKRKTKDGEKNMFSGLLVCSDCGANLGYHFNQGNPDIKYFNCTGYNTRRGDCPTTHYIRVDFLEQVVLHEVRRLTRYASKHEHEFAKVVLGYSQQSDSEQRHRKQKELYALTARDRELDNLFNRMYEDNVCGKIDDERFSRMSKLYTAEQSEITEKVIKLTAELEKQEKKAMTADMFISTVRKYTKAKKLNERMLNELIERIEVHHAEKIDGKKQQKITIYYNCIGAIEFPDSLTLPDIALNTRKGVTVSYDQ